MSRPQGNVLGTGLRETCLLWWRKDPLTGKGAAPLQEKWDKSNRKLLALLVSATSGVPTGVVKRFKDTGGGLGPGRPWRQSTSSRGVRRGQFFRRGSIRTLASGRAARPEPLSRYSCYAPRLVTGLPSATPRLPGNLPPARYPDYCGCGGAVPVSVS